MHVRYQERGTDGNIPSYNKDDVSILTLELSYTMKKLSPLGIVVGVLVTQGASYVLGFAFAIACLIIYGNKALVAFLEYPSSIAITFGLGLLATALGGFIAVALGKMSIINATICGALTLIISLAFLYAMDFKYVQDYRWMLALGLFLTIPSAHLGGHAYVAMHNSKIEPTQDSRG